MATNQIKKPVATKPVATKPVATKPVATKPAEVKPAEVKPAEVKPVVAKPAAKPAAKKTAAKKVSGQIPIDPATGEFAGQDIQSQTRQSLTNIRNILKEAGADMSAVVKTTVLLKDIGDFVEMNKVYAEFFQEPYPARAAFQVAAIPKGALVEIEAVAVVE